MEATNVITRIRANRRTAVRRPQAAIRSPLATPLLSPVLAATTRITSRSATTTTRSLALARATMRSAADVAIVGRVIEKRCAKSAIAVATTTPDRTTPPRARRPPPTTLTTTRAARPRPAARALALQVHRAARHPLALAHRLAALQAAAHPPAPAALALRLAALRVHPRPAAAPPDLVAAAITAALVKRLPPLSTPASLYYSSHLHEIHEE
jgi:hypothetical protein